MRSVFQVLFDTAKKLQQNGLFDKIVAVNRRSERLCQEFDNIVATANLSNVLNFLSRNGRHLDSVTKQLDAICQQERSKNVITT